MFLISPLVKKRHWRSVSKRNDHTEEDETAEEQHL